MASSSASQIDPRRPAQYTLKVGKTLKSGSSSSTFRSVKYNHKPDLPNGTRITKLSPLNNNDADLSIADDEDGASSKYRYKGQRRDSKTSYALIFDQESQTCTLEPVKSSYTFNITSTPWEASRDKLSRQYEQLQQESTATADRTLDGDPGGEPDPDNPFDFRHYLKGSAKGLTLSPSPSPALRPTKAGGTYSTVSSQTREKSEAKAKSKPVPKVDPLRQAPRKSVGKSTANPTPTVRLERKASTHHSDKAEKSTAKPSRPVKASAKSSTVKSDYYVHSSDDEADLEEAKDDLPVSGGLEVDMGNPPHKAHKAHKARSRVLDVPIQSSPHTGPISLHSAANSPMGRVVMPRQQQRRKQQYEQDVIDFGASDENDENDEELPRNSREDQDVDMRDTEQSEEDGDEDVEPMILGSPAHIPVAETTPPEAEIEADFDDDDFEAQMMEAMAGDDDQEELHVRQDESESESEAE